MMDRVLAVGRYLGQRQHLRFLTGAGGGLKTARATVDALLPQIAAGRALCVIGQPRHPRRLGRVSHPTGVRWGIFGLIDVIGQPLNTYPQRRSLGWIANLFTDHGGVYSAESRLDIHSSMRSDRPETT